LNLTGLSSKFGDKIFSATEVAHGKPKPDLFLHAAHRMNCLPDRTVVIEDSIAGVEAGAAAGMTILAYAGTFARAKLIKAGANFVFDERKLLPSLLQRTK
jgi:beta-phosphoglucomutase-like phosphatase (HAD superfamily)